MFNPPPETDPIVIAIAHLPPDIRKAAEETSPPPASNHFFLSLPDLISEGPTSHRARFLIACKEAGLEPFGGSAGPASRRALEYLRTSDCWGYEELDAESCDPTIKNVLAISFNEASLGTTLLKRDLGALLPSRLAETPSLGANSLQREGDFASYWTAIKSAIEEAIKDEQVDRLLLLGTQTQDDNFLRVLREVFEARGIAFTSLVEGSAVGPGNIFAAARGNAVVARPAMRWGTYACIENDWCPKGEEQGEEGEYVEAFRQPHMEL